VTRAAIGKGWTTGRRAARHPLVDVFTDDLLDTWVTYKRTHEVDALRLRPHPHEFTLYYDI